MSHSRNHLNPALIIKRFEPEQEVIKKEFPDTKIKYDVKGRKTVIKLNKKSFFNEQDNILINDHTYTHSKSDCFIKNELYFLNSDLLKQLYNSSNDILSKEYIGKLEPKSLEVSFNEYECLFSILLDENLKTNFKNITIEEKKTILKFFDSSHLRPLKYKSIDGYLKDTKRDPIKDLISFKNNVFSETKNIFESSMFKEKTYEECLIIGIIMTDFCKKILSPDIFSIVEVTLNQIPIIFHTLKNNENVEEIKDSQLIYVESKNVDFLLGDNTVYTVYKSDNLSIIDKINEYLKKSKVINENLDKVSIMVVSPNNIILNVINKMGDKNILVDDEFVFLINALTVFITDEWIVSKNIIKSKNEIINISIFKSLKTYNFFEKDISKLLYNLNYDIGIENEFDIFNELFLNNLIYTVESFILNKGFDFKEYIIPKDYFDFKFINDTNNNLLHYLCLRINKIYNEIAFEKKEVSVYVGIRANMNNYEGSNFYSLDAFDRSINYDFLLLKINK